MSTAIVVLGMHRSGTSALTGALGRLGADLGRLQDVSEGAEHMPIRECNAAILEALGGHWSAPVGFDPGWEELPRVREVEHRCKEALAELCTADVFAFKDPRTCLTFGLWRGLLPPDPVVVISYRHPLEVAASLNRRNGFGIAHGIALWERYNRALLDSAAGLRSIAVAYSDLSGDAAGTLARVERDLAGLGVTLSGELGAAASGVDPERRHHVYDETPESVVLPPQRALWSVLTGLPTVTGEAASYVLDDPHPIVAELLAQRAESIRLRREVGRQSGELRSRRVALRRLVTRRSPHERA